MVTPVDSAQPIRFGVFELDCRAHELRRKGTRIRLQEQPYRVLVLLLEHAGEIVTREELRAKLWPSSVFVDFDHGLNNAIARLREALGDAAAAPHFIETLPRRGYRFIYPLIDPAPAGSTGESPPPAEDGVDTTDAAAGTRNRERSGWSRPWSWYGLAAGLMLAVVAGLAIYSWQSGRVIDTQSAGEVPADVPSIAVLPFASLSADPDNEYFADGMSEELTSKLASVRGLKVAAHTSSFGFKDTQESASDIARALNVNYLLEGSVRHSGSRVRVTVQLIEAASGYHVWSGTFDRELTDTLHIQEEIGLAVAGALQVELIDDADQR